MLNFYGGKTMNKLIPEQMKLFELNLSEEEYNKRFERFTKLYFILRG